MPKFAVGFIATASKTIVVEAENAEQAQDIAYNQFEYPTAMAGVGYDLGDWFIDEDIQEIPDND